MINTVEELRNAYPELVKQIEVDAQKTMASSLCAKAGKLMSFQEAKFFENEIRLLSAKNNK